MHAQLQAIVARWDGFIAQTREQFERVLQEAWNAAAPLVAAVDLDLVPLTQAWGAVDHQLRVHVERVSDGWERICEEFSSVDGLPEDFVYREGCKRDAATRELELRHAQFTRTIMARAAEQMRLRALGRDAAGHLCPHCRGILAVCGTVIGQARSVRCGCGADVMVEPADGWRMFAANGARLLADELALPHYEAMLRAELAIRQYRDRKQVPLELLASYEQAARRHWTTVFEAEASYVPELRAHVPAKIAMHMKAANRLLADYWQWRQHAAAR